LADTGTLTSEVRERRRSLATLLASAIRLDLPIIALWLALGAGLAVVTSRIVDWFVMTDELLYERLAVSIAQTHSPLPRLHGELVGNVNQLYPLLLSPLYRHLTPTALHDAHILNAFVMSSAVIPAFFLARTVTDSRSLSYLVAMLSVCVPWIALSSFLLTEVAAYPAFLWGVLALQHAAASPRARNDVLALVAVLVAVLARTQLAVLFVVLPIAFLIHELGFTAAASSPWRARIQTAGRELVSAHRLLAGIYAAAALAAVGLAAAGRLSSVLGTYSVAAKGNLVPAGIGRSLLDHVAAMSLGLAILPFIVGVAWLLAGIFGAPTRERHAFASIGAVTIVALVFEVTSFDLRFGSGTVHDRYLFYVAPIVLVAFAAALSDSRWPRWSLLIPTALLAVAFFRDPLPTYENFRVDSPVSVLNDRLLAFAGSLRGAQLLLGLGTIVLAILLLQASVLLRRARLAALLVVLTAAALPAETGYALSRLLETSGTNGRPATLAQDSVFTWIDRDLGVNADVTIVPYPLGYGDYLTNGGHWWDIEFWNASVQHEAVYRARFSWTPDTFPKTTLSFDPATGRANVSPSDYVAQSVADTRFHVAGKPTPAYGAVVLTRAEQPWRTEWLTTGLYDDGWTRAGVSAAIRVFAVPGQTTRVKRYLTLTVRAPADSRGAALRVSSNLAEVRTRALAETSSQVAVCVPAGSFADVHVSTPARSPIAGDPQSAERQDRLGREGGVLLTQIALADETGSC
jgi:hypothetical protein